MNRLNEDISQCIAHKLNLTACYNLMCSAKAIYIYIKPIFEYKLTVIKEHPNIAHLLERFVSNDNIIGIKYMCKCVLEKDNSSCMNVSPWLVDILPIERLYRNGLKYASEYINMSLAIYFANRVKPSMVAIEIAIDTNNLNLLKYCVMNQKNEISCIEWHGIHGYALSAGTIIYNPQILKYIAAQEAHSVHS
jgi:hypothetical protein